ncbi:MAG: hypothetical protein WC455_12285 [Dehalococcoidia bacterium]|jgi:hypothetical protein
MVVNDVVYLAGDSAMIDDTYALDVVPSPKVFAVGDLMFGWCGSFRMANILQYGIKYPKRRSGEPADRYIKMKLTSAIRKAMLDGGVVDSNSESALPGDMLVGYEKRLYKIQQDFSAVESTRGFITVGAGCQFALGAVALDWPIKDNVQSRIKTIMGIVSGLCSAVVAPYHIIRSDSKEIETYG